MMRLSSGGQLFLSELEGKRNRMYLDSAGYPTIGIGHRILEDESYLMTAQLTDAQVYALLARDLPKFENVVNTSITADINQQQFDALVPLAFNIGVTGFRDSTVVERINAKDTEANIREAWGRWRIAGGQVNQGLINRRKKEMDLFFKGAAEKKQRDITVYIVLAVIALAVGGYIFFYRKK